jgi:tetratricopeptide (TPR) repeat protein
MPEPEEHNNIYNTQSTGGKPPEQEYATLPLTRAKRLTRNRVLTGVLLIGSSFTCALWLALTYRSDTRDDNENKQQGFQPELISLQSGVEITATGITNSLADRFDVSSYLPEEWGELPNSDKLANPNIQILNPSVQPVIEPTNLIIETNDVPTLLARVAEQFIRDGKLELAEEQLNLALKQRPDDANCLHLLGTIHATRGEHEQAIAHYKKLIERNPYKEDYYNNLAVAYIRAGKLDEAEEQLKTALNTNRNYYDAHINLAILYQQRNRHDLVVKQLEPIISNIPKHTNARRYLGTSLLAIGEPYRARSYFVELVRLLPDNGDNYLRVAECYAHEDLPEKAAAWLKLASDHATLDEIEAALQLTPFQRHKDDRSIKLFRKNLVVKEET